MGVLDLHLVRFISPKAQAIAPEFKNSGVAERRFPEGSNPSPRKKTQIQEALRDRTFRVDADHGALVAWPKI